MRKVKHTIAYHVPSWNFCNHDGSCKASKETCRFCVKTRAGYRCTLHDTALSAQGSLVDKCYQCIQATAGFTIEVDQPTPARPVVDPKLIMRETLSIYKKTVEQLISQGYPRQMAETIATKYVLEDTSK